MQFTLQVFGYAIKQNPNNLLIIKWKGFIFKVLKDTQNMNINVITEDTKQEKYSKTTSGKTRTVNQVTKDTSRMRNRMNSQ